MLHRWQRPSGLCTARGRPGTQRHVHACARPLEPALPTGPAHNSMHMCSCPCTPCHTPARRQSPLTHAHVHGRPCAQADLTHTATCARAGMAGSGKTTFIQRLHSHLHARKQPPYIINMDPAVTHVPYNANIDIRDTVRTRACTPTHPFTHSHIHTHTRTHTHARLCACAPRVGRTARRHYGGRCTPTGAAHMHVHDGQHSPVAAYSPSLGVGMVVRMCAPFQHMGCMA